jgi:hypothetical protein
VAGCIAIHPSLPQYLQTRGGAGTIIAGLGDAMTMMNTPHAVSTARHTLGQRIARFLDRLEHDNRDPNPLEGALLLDALSHLATLQLPSGEELMTKAEQAGSANPQDMASVRRPYDPVTSKNLRSALSHILDRTTLSTAPAEVKRQSLSGDTPAATL